MSPDILENGVPRHLFSMMTCLAPTEKAHKLEGGRHDEGAFSTLSFPHVPLLIVSCLSATYIRASMAPLVCSRGPYSIALNLYVVADRHRHLSFYASMHAQSRYGTRNSRVYAYEFMSCLDLMPCHEAAPIYFFGCVLLFLSCHGAFPRGKCVRMTQFSVHAAKCYILVLFFLVVLKQQGRGTCSRAYTLLVEGESHPGPVWESPLQGSRADGC